MKNILKLASAAIISTCIIGITHAENIEDKIEIIALKSFVITDVKFDYEGLKEPVTKKEDITKCKNIYSANIDVVFSNQNIRSVNLMDGDFEIIIKPAPKEEMEAFKLGDGEFLGEPVHVISQQTEMVLSFEIENIKHDELLTFYNFVGDPNKRFKVLLDTKGWAKVGIANDGEGWNEKPFGSTFHFVPRFEDEVFMYASGVKK